MYLSKIHQVTEIRLEILSERLSLKDINKEDNWVIDRMIQKNYPFRVALKGPF